METERCAHELCRIRFDGLEAKFERIIAGLRDSIRGKFLSIQIAQQLASHQNEAAYEHRKYLASQINDINGRLDGVRIETKPPGTDIDEHVETPLAYNEKANFFVANVDDTPCGKFCNANTN